MMRTHFGLSAIAVIAACGAFARFSYGCSDYEPAPIARADGGSADSGTWTDAGAYVDDPSCGHCVSALSPSCRLRPLCRTNDVGGGKSSAALLVETQNCTCEGKCRTACALSCTGQGSIPASCSSCGAENCAESFVACLNDKDPFDSLCNDPFGGGL